MNCKNLLSLSFICLYIILPWLEATNKKREYKPDIYWFWLDAEIVYNLFKNQLFFDWYILQGKSIQPAELHH